MDTNNRPQTISAQEFGLRHMQALQRLRDETLLVFNGLEKAPQAELDQAFRALPRLVKDAVPDFATEYSRAKTSLALTALRRALQMNSRFFERIFGEPGQPAADRQAAEAQTSQISATNPIELFREKLKAAGNSEIPAATMVSLAALERMLAEELAGSDSALSRPDLELVLVEMDRDASGSDGQFQAKPWQQKVGKGERPSIDTRLIESIFATSIIAAHEALRAGEKIHAQKKTLT